MSHAAPARRFAPTTSAASCGRSTCSTRASSRPRARSAPSELRAVEDHAIAEIVKFQEDVGPEEHHRRRIPPHLLPHRLPRAARRREDRHPGHRHQARRHRRAGAAGDARGRQGAPREGHPARRLRIPEEPGRRRAARRRSRSRRRRCCTFAAGAPASAREHYPELDPDVLRRRRQRLRRRTALACRRRLHLRADGRHQPGLPVRRARCAKRRAQRGDDPNELPHRYARFINQVVAQKPGRHDARDAPVPRQLQEHARGRAGQLRAGGRGAARRDERRRLLPRVRRRPLAATSSRCASCRRARPSCSASSRPSSASWREGRR